jgi:uncharacterized damage-inducible protein DinB
MFNYDHYANKQMLHVILKANNPEKTVQLMAHLLAAQRVWLNRCGVEPSVSVPLWPDWKADVFEQMIDDHHDKWVTLLESLQPEDFDKTISYTNFKGEDLENKLSDVLGHVINHGTHHRAQIGQHLLITGIELPITDYIFYLRK